MITQVYERVLPSQWIKPSLHIVSSHCLNYCTNWGIEDNKSRLHQDKINRPTLAICTHSNAYSQGLNLYSQQCIQPRIAICTHSNAYSQGLLSVLTALHTAKACYLYSQQCIKPRLEICSQKSAYSQSLQSVLTAMHTVKANNLYTQQYIQPTLAICTNSIIKMHTANPMHTAKSRNLYPQLCIQPRLAKTFISLMAHVGSLLFPSLIIIFHKGIVSQCHCHTGHGTATQDMALPHSTWHCHTVHGTATQYMTLQSSRSRGCRTHEAISEVMLDARRSLHSSCIFLLFTFISMFSKLWWLWS